MKVMWPSSLFMCLSLLISLSASSPTSRTTESDHSEPPLNSTVPLEFPQFNQNYPFVDNSSIRQNLASHSENDTEVDDLLGLDVKEKPNGALSTTVSSILENSVPIPSEEDDDISMRDDTEWIEEDGDNTEDQKLFWEVREEVTKESSSTYDVGYPLFEGQIAAILAGTFLLVSLIIYGGLISYRRFLENKYGSREMLVNEDDFVDPDDMKHFSI